MLTNSDGSENLPLPYEKNEIFVSRFRQRSAQVEKLDRVIRIQVLHHVQAVDFNYLTLAFDFE